ncbi:helix-turn-helix transcriptional regulator [Caulobacter mirabilis]|uniref:AraC family transcriptional regulator n=1 Tax=Caulobacter mirabilis TaxID=69666 RepID=A0A2D2AXK8_9CAUL|nr:AraC family transcriptional regulator [Caulobacter mirabilis]ATQ42760.1 AraC family transcriptional regulator [Caulobacter mirabilis]
MVAVFSPGRFYGTLQAEHLLAGLRVAHLAGTTPEHEVAEHGHDDAHFVLATRGRYLTTAQGEASEGPVLVFNPPDVVHRDRFAGDGGWFMALSFEAATWRDLMLRPSSDAIRLSRPSAVGTALRLTRAVVAQDACPLHLESLALELAAQAERQPVDAVRAPAWLRRADDLIADRRAEALTVADVAEAAGVHPVYLARAFRRWLNCSPGDRLRQRRLERAASLITRQAAHLAEVAALSGFCDQGHLTRVFRAAWGVTPGEYRRLAA